MGKFKTDNTFEERKQECEKILEYWPDKIPIVVEKNERSTLGEMPKPKLLCPNNYRFSQFLACLRAKLNLSSRESVFVFIESTIMKGDEPMQKIYEEYKSEDGFLYLEYFEHENLG